MNPYKDMYYKLFDATMQAIELLQEAHRDTEKMLMLSAEQEEGQLRSFPEKKREQQPDSSD